MMPYLVWSFDYSHASAGQKSLHRLCHELNAVGQRAYIGNGYATNPEWRTPHPPAPLTDFIAVYPEIVRGNPWAARRVARWVLNVPGRLGGDRTYDPAELVFSWSTLFCDAPLLHLPAIETDIYFDRGEPRSGAAFYVGKGVATESIPGAVEVTLAMREDRYALADVLNRVERLYSFDAVSGMNDIARLCGCPVVIVPTGERLEPDGYAAVHAAAMAAFPAQLAAFIATTQAVA